MSHALIRMKAGGVDSNIAVTELQVDPMATRTEPTSAGIVIIENITEMSLKCLAEDQAGL
jgi:hypothetical protein